MGNVSNLIKVQIKRTLTLLKQDLYLYLLILIIAIDSGVTCYLYGYESMLDFFAYLVELKRVIVPSIASFLFVYTIYMYRIGVKQPIKHMFNKSQALPKHIPQLVSGLILLSAISVFISNYTSLKALIPLIHPFSYDRVLHDIDLKIFLGHEPWRLILGDKHSPYITAVLNLAYNLWFLFLWWILLYFVFNPTKKSRSQYLTTFVLSWFVIGVLMAMTFSSAGPAFSNLIDSKNNNYLTLMRVLNEDNNWLIEQNSVIKIWALGTQNELWQSYSTGKEMLGSGISAMPSMHVSMATLMALGMYSVNRMLGIVAWCYVLVIYIGSFTLGWHYAVDGVVSAIFTYAIWFTCGLFTNRSHPTFKRQTREDY